MCKFVSELDKSFGWFDVLIIIQTSLFESTVLAADPSKDTCCDLR